MFYKPLTKSYYRPPVSRLDEGRLPVTNFPKSIRFDGGLTCGLLCYCTDPINEPFPPGTRVTIEQAGKPCRGTILNIPLPLTPNVKSAETNSDSSSDLVSATYTILLNNY